MTDGTLETIDGRPALRFERRLPHPVERVWRAVTEPAELDRWFVAPVPWTPTLGETFEGGGQTGRITELDPPHTIGWEWGASATPSPWRPPTTAAACCSSPTSSTRPTAARRQHAAGWETYFARLDAHLAGRSLSEERAHELVGELHERYAAAFDEDPRRAGG